MVSLPSCGGAGPLGPTGVTLHDLRGLSTPEVVPVTASAAAGPSAPTCPTGSRWAGCPGPPPCGGGRSPSRPAGWGAYLWPPACVAPSVYLLCVVVVVAPPRPLHRRPVVCGGRGGGSALRAGRRSPRRSLPSRDTDRPCPEGVSAGSSVSGGCRARPRLPPSRRTPRVLAPVGVTRRSSRWGRLLSYQGAGPGGLPSPS